MQITQYFNENKILWFPLDLDTSGGNKRPKYNQDYKAQPKSNDFINLSKSEIEDRQKYQSKYIFGACDLSVVKHIDIDFKKDEEYTQEEKDFVENAKEKFPYFLSSKKQLPHFLFMGDCQEKARHQTKYKDIEILNKGWSFFKLDSQIINKDIEIPNYNIFENLVLLNKNNKSNSNKKINSDNFKKNDLGYCSEEESSAVSDKKKELLNLINNTGEGVHYDDYIRIIWSLKNDSLKNYKMALEWSQKSNKHNLGEFNKVWKDGKEKGLSLGTVHYNARLHNPELYNEKFNNETIEGTEEALSELFMNLEGENIVCSNSTVYIYTGGFWREDNKNLMKLKKLVRYTLNKLLCDKLILSLSKNDYEKHKELNRIHQKIQMKKTIDNVSAFIVQDCYSRDNDIQFDINKEQLYNINFRNGIFDLKKMKFRKRNKYDYITKYLNWDYNPDVDIESLEEVKDFFRRLQGDKEQRDFSICWLASCLDGNLDKSKFKMNIGYTAENGKSTEFLIHSSVFPIYSTKLSSSFFSIDNNKRHKELLPLMQNPIRFCYIEELRQNKLDADFLKEFSDGKLNCEILYSTSLTANIQATLSTCANKDFNIDLDQGISRRGIIQFYKSEFKEKYKQDDYQNNKFMKKQGYFRKFEECEKMKNAYFHYLLTYYNNFKIPIGNEKLFTSISEEYDTIGQALNDNFIITESQEDIIHKNELFEVIKSSINIKSFTWRKCLTEMKNRGIKYNKQKYKNGMKGYFIGIKINETIETDDEE
tara:strand:+ start:108 stop:2390 length:2283 start_codon:yes stop_codon:yes gene_type:complete